MYLLEVLFVTILLECGYNVFPGILLREEGTLCIYTGTIDDSVLP